MKNIYLIYILDFPNGSDGKESICNVGELDLIPGSGRSPGEANDIHSSILNWRIPWTKMLILKGGKKSETFFSKKKFFSRHVMLLLFNYLSDYS